jgi:hypothetical protein
MLRIGNIALDVRSTWTWVTAEDGREWPASRCGRFALIETSLVRTALWAAEALLTLWTWEKYFPCREWNPGHPSVSLSPQITRECQFTSAWAEVHCAWLQPRSGFSNRDAAPHCVSGCLISAAVNFIAEPLICRLFSLWIKNKKWSCKCL